MTDQEPQPTGTWVVRIDRDHQCELPDIIDPTIHAEQDTFDQERFAAWREDIHDIPPRPHDCDICVNIQDGSVWSCNTCGSAYKVKQGTWQRLTPENNYRLRVVAGADHSPIPLAASFIAGGMLL